MCCFSGPVRMVENTRIFGRLTGRGTQMLVYSMAYSSADPVAMILPLPVQPPATEPSIRFLNLQSYPLFFHDLEAAFPYLLPRPRSGGAPGGAPSRVTLAVQEVGDFVASFVPRLADFDRLDKRFRLPLSVLDQVPDYHDYGFAVFQLRQTRAGSTVHPMALEFVTRLRETVFFPTVHVHDGKVHPFEEFHHALYVQDPRLASSGSAGFAYARDPKVPLVQSVQALGARVDVRRSQRVVQPNEPGYRLLLRGELPNKDTLIRMG